MLRLSSLFTKNATKIDGIIFFSDFFFVKIKTDERNSSLCIY